MTPERALTILILALIAVVLLLVLIHPHHLF